MGDHMPRQRDTEVIPGYRGAFFPFQLSRLDSRNGVLDFKLPLAELPPEDVRANSAITQTGVFSHAALIIAIQASGVDNAMFSTALRGRRSGARHGRAYPPARPMAAGQASRHLTESIT
jgi:hypothetical protein